MPMGRWLAPFLALLGTTCGCAADSAPPVALARETLPPLASHVAEYRMQLNQAFPSSGLAHVRGRMRYVFQEQCDGWTIESNTELELYFRHGAIVTTNYSMRAWEARDFSRFRFMVRNLRNGAPWELHEGEAVRQADGSLSVTYKTPSGQAMNLPPGVMFPTQHTFAFLREARANTRLFSALVFDGTELKEATLMSVAIGARLPPGTPSEIPDHALLAGESWPAVMAYFRPDGMTELPEFETRMRYHDNAVAERVEQRFDDFALDALLERLDPLTPPDC